MLLVLFLNNFHLFSKFPCFSFEHLFSIYRTTVSTHFSVYILFLPHDLFFKILITIVPHGTSFRKRYVAELFHTL